MSEYGLTAETGAVLLLNYIFDYRGFILMKEKGESENKRNKIQNFTKMKDLLFFKNEKLSFYQ